MLILAFTLYCIVSEHLYKLRLHAENKDHYVYSFCVSVPWEIVYCSFVIEKYIWFVCLKFGIQGVRPRLHTKARSSQYM